MVYTVTFSPAIDYVVSLSKFSAGGINRADKEEIFIGGKGTNVSWILNNLEVKTKALGFVAGFTGDLIEKSTLERGILTDFIHLKSGFSRINVKIKTELETEVNGQGPDIDESDVDELFYLLEQIGDGDILVLAGSIPKALPTDIYEKIIKNLIDINKKIRYVVDATGDLLLNVLKYKPFLVKPNHFELADMFKVKIETMDDVIFYAKKLKEMGAVNVLVSLAEHGSVLLDEFENIHIMKAIKGDVVNSVGAGDSMLAGFIAGYLEKQNYDYALKLGTASGAATAFSAGLAEKAEIYKMLEKLV